MKRCFKCGIEKPIDEFYRHPAMADGRLGKCKDCAKLDVIANRARKIDYYREYDRGRTDEPHRVDARRAYAERRKSDPELRAIDRARSAAEILKTPDKRVARIALGNAVRDGRITPADLCERCGAAGPLHGHHEDYDKPLDVVWLCRRCHGRRHRAINAERRRLTQVKPQKTQPPIVAKTA